MSKQAITSQENLGPRQQSHAQKIWPQIMKFQRLHSNHEITNQVINNYIHMVEGNNSEFKNRSISFLQHDLYNQ